VFSGSPEDIRFLGDWKFDLIIARDILEHVTDIGQVIRNIAALAEPGWTLSFPHPNGKRMCGALSQPGIPEGTSELLINHAITLKVPVC